MENCNLFQYPWYYGKINRQEAEENLKDRGENEGCFLVRESQSRVGQWTLSVLEWANGQCNVGHFLINRSVDEKFYFDEETQFDSIPDLIDYYRDNSAGVNFDLGEPCPREIKMPEKDADDYTLYETATELPMEEEFIQERLLYAGEISSSWKGHLKSCASVPIVAKIAKSGENAGGELYREAQMLKFLNHENIVRFKGLMSSKSELHVILQWGGDINLIGFLLNNSSSKLSLIDQVNVAIQIASALEFCARLKCVHRNVKAKSVIISTSDLKCKLGSFRNCRTVDEYGYYHASTAEEKCKIFNNSRIRWMSIEAAKHGRFSQASDVWSFAVLLTEIFTGGGLPYAGYLTYKVLDEIEDGFRCPRPKSCPREIYKVMQTCWIAAESDRPTFQSIKNSLAKYIDDNREVLLKWQPAKSSEWSRYAPVTHGSVKQPRTTSVKIPQRATASPLPPIPGTTYGYDN